mmetsp:Transcript_35109/g.99931  ORF Transcript_35109/g.99931 Transcript_35109/m.99931 type:complete len:309 (-) Transcript_35109:671-1597(-)
MRSSGRIICSMPSDAKLAKSFVELPGSCARPLSAPSTSGFLPLSSGCPPGDRPMEAQSPSASSLKKSLAKRTRSCAAKGSEPNVLRPWPTERILSFARWMMPLCFFRSAALWARSFSESAGSSSSSTVSARAEKTRKRPLPTTRDAMLMRLAMSTGSCKSLQAIGFIAATTSSRASPAEPDITESSPASVSASMTGCAPCAAMTPAKRPMRFLQMRPMTRRPSATKPVATRRACFAARAASKPPFFTPEITRCCALSQVIVANRRVLMSAAKSRYKWRRLRRKWSGSPQDKSSMLCLQCISFLSTRAR